MNPAWTQAQKVFAGGVNSPVRAFKAVGGEPVFMERGFGPFLYDNEGKRYVDFCLSWGAILLGHADEGVSAAIKSQVDRGTSFGTATEYETRLGQEIQKAFPGMERIRFASSGTEAVMSAIRLARGWTGRDRIAKFEGCYHGHSDGLLVKAGSGLATFGSPDSAGVPRAFAGLTSVLAYNDVQALERFFRLNEPPACVIVEPVAANMGVVPAGKKFLEALRKLCTKHHALLIFDEVITGFRIQYGGAQHFYGIEPDITILGKVIGGGLPIGAFGAKKKIMEGLSPAGRVYQAGTLSGNPLSMVAGLSVLSRLDRGFYEKLNAKTRAFTARLSRMLRRARHQAVVRPIGSLFTVFFAPKAPANFADVLRCDKKAYARFFHRLLDAGVYFPPSAFEASFVSASHTEAELEAVLNPLYAARQSGYPMSLRKKGKK